MSNSFDPDQAQHFVGPDLVPKCLQKLSADDTSSQRVKLSSSSQVVTFVIKLIVPLNFCFDIFVGPDLVPKCFQKLSADDTSWQSVKLSIPA